MTLKSLKSVPDWLAEIVVVSTVSQEHAINVVRRIVETKSSIPIEAKDPSMKRLVYFPSDKFPFQMVEDTP
jgi:hypothetical protein